MNMNLNFEQTRLTKVTDIEIPQRWYQRMVTGIEVVDELLQEGFLPGSTITLTAPAGCGKTQFMLQTLNGLANNGYKTAYCSGEENIFQLAMTSKRIGAMQLNIANISDVDDIAELTKDYDFIVVDSFQSLTTKTKMNQSEKERYSINKLVKAAQDNECCICFILHLTKAGQLKGSTLIPHTCDVNMNIDIDYDIDDTARTISFSKNRFGPCNTLTLYLTSTGYDMSSKVVVSEKKYTSTKNKKDVIKRDILKMKAIPHVEEIASKYNVSVVYCSTALRELISEGKVLKKGRGKNAQLSVA